MWIELEKQVPLIIWGEPAAEYTAYFSYNQKEEVDEKRFNRFVNLGISADDMFVRLGGNVSLAVLIRAQPDVVVDGFVTHVRFERPDLLHGPRRRSSSVPDM